MGRREKVQYRYYKNSATFVLNNIRNQPAPNRITFFKGILMRTTTEWFQHNVFGIDTHFQLDVRNVDSSELFIISKRNFQEKFTENSEIVEFPKLKTIQPKIPGE